MFPLVLIQVGLILVIVGRLTPKGSQAGQAVRRVVGVLHWLLYGVGGLVTLVGLIYGGAQLYVNSQQPPLPPELQQALAQAPQNALAAAQPSTGGAVPTNLPPSRIRIGRIGADWPILLSDLNYDLRTQAVGWIVGSAFPGAPGNMVLYGQLDGPYGTFTRLHELQVGDEMIVWAGQIEYRYRVRAVKETFDDDVAVMAPTTSPTATLITDSPKSLDRRLVVIADYLAR